MFTGCIGRPPDGFHHEVSGLLQRQDRLHHFRVVGRDRDAGVIAEKVGGVEEPNVQDMTANPFAAVQQPSKLPYLWRHADTTEALHGVSGAHLIRHGANAADPCRDVHRLREVAAPQEGLEEPWRLVNLQPDVGDLPVLHLDMHGPLALDPGQVPARESRRSCESLDSLSSATRSASARNSGDHPE